jgi:NADPH:quinone reductase-like Zn-dependent oxidoreductase
MTARTTWAFVLEELGYDGLRERRREVPATASDQILVRLKAASLNYRDLKILKGTYARPPRLPVVLLSDGAGEVVEVGSKVTHFKAGDRVLPIYMEGWHSGPMTTAREGWKSRGGDIDGTASEFALYREQDIVAIPSSVSTEEAACIPCAGVTAWHALVSVGHVQPGETVLVMGSGGVSVFALQIAQIKGARVIVLSGDDRKLERLAALGASDGINYRKTPDWDETVRGLTMGHGVDHVVEVGGAGTVARSLRATRDGGQVHVIGNLTGAFPSSMTAERGIRMTPIVVGSRDMTQDLLGALAAHEARPVISKRVAFSDLKKALAYMESGEHFGKIVITI